MKKTHSAGIVTMLIFLCISCFSGFAKGQSTPSSPGLSIGDKAPPLNAIWLKGKPSGSFGDGKKVYIVELWATWCPPCREAMPHLSALAQKYRGRVEVLSISVYEYAHINDKSLDYLKKVKAFVDNAHDMMDYPVGADDAKGTVAQDWPVKKGIPCSFVIDQKGAIAWIGQPRDGLDEIVELTLEGKLNKEAIAQVSADFDARDAKFQRLVHACSLAEKAGNYKQLLDSAERAMAVLPEYEDVVIPYKYEALDRQDRQKARAYAQEILKKYKNAPMVLVGMANMILDDAYKAPDYETALAFLQAGMKYVDPGEGYQMALLAKAYYKTGNVDMAVKTQETVLKLMEDPIREASVKTKEKAQQQLAIYRGSKPASK